MGLGAVFEKAQKQPWIFRITVVAFIAGVLAQYCLIIQYKIFFTYNHVEFSLAALKQAIAAIIPWEWSLKEFSEQLNSGFGISSFSRSTNILKLYFSYFPGEWDRKSFLYFIIFPCFQIFFLAITLIGWYCFWINQKKYQITQARYFLMGFLFFALFSNGIVAFCTPDLSEEKIVKRITAYTLSEKADLLYQQRKFGSLEEISRSMALQNEALALYLEALEQNSGIWTIPFKEANIYTDKNNLLEANKYYLKSIELNPRNGYGFMNLGYNLISSGDLEKGEIYLKKALEIEALNAKIYDRLGQIYAKTKKNILAEKMFKVAFSLDPGYGPFYINYAVFLTSQKRHKEGILSLKKGIELGAKGNVVNNLSKYYQLSLS